MLREHLAAADAIDRTNPTGPAMYQAVIDSTATSPGPRNRWAGPAKRGKNMVTAPVIQARLIGFGR